MSDIHEIVRNIVYTDTPEGFISFYSYIHNREMPRHAREWVHKIYEAKKEKKGICIEAFRGSTKTTVGTTFVAYRIGLEPQRANLIIQVGDDTARDNTQLIASMIENNAGFKYCFPHVVPDKEKGWGASGYEVMRTDMDYGEWRRLNSDRKDPTLVGLGRTSRGIIGKHPDGVCLIDDIDDETTTSSARERETTRKILTGTIFPTFTPTTWKIVIGTPWTFDDTLHYVKSTGEFKHSFCPVRVDGKPTWPEKFDEEEIESQRRLAGEIEFARMFLLDLEKAKGINLKWEWVSSYKFENLDKSWPMFMGIDYASTADRIRIGEDRDYFAAAWGRITPNGTLVLEDGIRAKISQADAEQRIISFVQMYPYLKQIGVESIGKGEEFYTLLMRAPVFMPLMPIRSHTGEARSKGSRFEKVLAKLFQYGRIMISDRETEFLKAFKDEWISWPGAQHDDTLDAVYMMVKAAEGYISIPSIQPDPTMSPVFEKRKKRVNPWSELRNV